MPAVHVLISGRVQGVGFRAFVQRKALEFGITGEVWNTRNGNVELRAAHSDSAVLLAFEATLSNGPGFVSSVSSKPIADFESSMFAIGKTR